jgi:hypothetical protein
MWRLSQLLVRCDNHVRTFEPRQRQLEGCMKQTTIISAFPGMGKSSIEKDGHIDLDSSVFPKDQFPINYVNRIVSLIGGCDVLFVSSHKEVRDELRRRDIQFTLVFPSVDSKDQFLLRYKQRGNSQEFIDKISNNWEDWINDCRNDVRPYAFDRWEISGLRYLSDSLEAIKQSVNLRNSLPDEGLSTDAQHRLYMSRYIDTYQRLQQPDLFSTTLIIKEICAGSKAGNQPHVSASLDWMMQTIAQCRQVLDKIATELHMQKMLKDYVFEKEVIQEIKYLQNKISGFK